MTSFQVPASLKLLFRSRYLLKLINGENHPEMAQIDQNIGLGMTHQPKS